MINSLHPLDIFLHPGDYCFAGRNTRIRTLLGSCVSITFWHPQLLVGGMCHYLLPERSDVRRIGEWPAPDGRYADVAVALLLKEIDAVGVSYKECLVKLFGGSSMLPKTYQNNIGIQNVQAARRLVKQYDLICVAEHLGGVGPRNVIFEIWSGDVWVNHRNVLPIAEHKLINRSTR
jgi:chemotaxis protein CheD